jgi:hypothetical protein
MPSSSAAALRLRLLQITTHFEGLPGRRLPLKGESAEYSLEVVKYDKGSKGELKADCKQHSLHLQPALCKDTPGLP